LTGPLSEKQLKYARRIQANSDRLVSFINDILIYRLRRRPVELRREQQAIGSPGREVVGGRELSAAMRLKILVIRSRPRRQ
jgi:hypothetical protein